MAPGCFSTTTSKDSEKEKKETTMLESETAPSSLLVEALKSVESSVENDDEILIITANNTSKETPSITTSTSLLLKSDDSYTSAEIDLDSIPLPLSPPPPLPSSHTDDDDHDEDEEDEDEEDSDDDDDDQDEEDEEDDDKEEGKNLVKNTPRLFVARRRCANQIFDTVDAFEILEQTIIKQKRVAKLKNTDLRRKVLLKRTFDLVCEIMDRENGFNDDDSEIQAAIRPKPTSKTTPVATKIENEEPEEVIVESTSSNLELELHDHSRMDESDEEDDEEEDEETEESIKAATTLVKLVDLDQPMIELESAQVPRQVKRRSSSDDDEEYDYEYSMNHLNDQQLNYKTTTNNRHPLDHESDLNIYSDGDSLVNVKPNQEHHAANANANAASTRSNHSRKKLKI